MNVLFLTLARINSIEERGIYPDLLRKFRDEGHSVTIVSPLERRLGISTCIVVKDDIRHLQVRTLNITNTHFIEKGIATLSIENQYLYAIKAYLKEIKFDLILYSTPPITFGKAIQYVKKRDEAYTYLLLKDIFPQNAVDMGMIQKEGLLHKYFKKKEKKLYNISKTIGCMSPANVQFIIKHNPYLDKSKIEVNPNSISPFFIDYKELEKIEIRKQYNLPLDKIILAYGGNLGIPQGVDFLLETISNLKEPKAHILVVGSGTQFNKIEDWFKNHNPSNATLLSGLPKNDYDTLIAACDVGLIFLHKDFTIPNFPSRLLTYLEMKKPVLAATDNNTDLGIIIEEAGCGYWVESGDNEAMQAKISKLCINDLKHMGQKAWELLQNEYLVEKSYNLIVDKTTLSNV